MFSKRGPETIPANITIKSQGETLTAKVTFFNRTKAEYAEAAKAENFNALAYLVKEWDLPFDLSESGIEEMEDLRPGTGVAIIQAYFKARQSELEKN